MKNQLGKERKTLQEYLEYRDEEKGMSKAHDGFGGNKNPQTKISTSENTQLMEIFLCDLQNDVYLKYYVFQILNRKYSVSLFKQ